MKKELDVILLRIFISESDVKIVFHEHKNSSQN